MRHLSKFALLLCVLMFLSVVPAFASGDGDHSVHYSLLHFIINLLPEGSVPTPATWGQPDVIPNTYLIVVLLVVFMILATRRVEWIPTSRLQNLLEMIVDGITGFFGDILGHEGRKYAPFVGVFFLFILCLNWLGLIPGFQSPTANLNTTLALGITAVAGVQIISIRENGLSNHLKHFLGEPVWLAPLMLPLHLIGEIARALSLSVRLFGNIYGEETVIIRLVGMAVLLVPLAGKVPWLPVQFPMMLFGIFGGLIQALVFSILTSIYIVTFLAHDEGHSEGAH